MSSNSIVDGGRDETSAAPAARIRSLGEGSTAPAAASSPLAGRARQRPYITRCIVSRSAAIANSAARMRASARSDNS